MMHLKKLKISRPKLSKPNIWYIVSVLITLRYLLPSAVDDVIGKSPVAETAIAVVPLLVFIAVVIKEGIRFRFTIFSFFAFYLVYVVSTIKNGGAVMTVVIQSVHVLMLCVVADDFLSDGKKADHFMAAIRDIALVFFIANFIVTFIYPDGIPAINPHNSDAKFFLYNNVNSTVKYIFPGLCSSIILDIRKHRAISFPTAMFFIGIFENAIRIYFTATAVVALVFIIIWSFAIELFKGKEKWAYLAVLLAVTVFEILLVINGGMCKPLAVFITGIFGKTANFSGRKKLWKRASRLIMKRPILGWGHRVKYFWGKYIKNRSGSHNYFLDIAMQRGLLGEGIFIGILIAPFFLMGKKKLTREQRVYIGFVGAILLMYLVEPFMMTEYLIIPIVYMLPAMFTTKGIEFRKFRLKLLKGEDYAK